MGRADLQLHSDLGDGLSSIGEILDSAERAGLDVIALTDHDDIRGAFALRELAAQRSSPVAVVPGVEVTTRSGHLLALWIEEEVPMFCSLTDALSRIHEAGGVAIVPHPLSYLTFSIGEGALRQLAAYGDDALMVDAIDEYLGVPGSGLPGMLAPTGHHDATHAPIADAAAPASTPPATQEV